MPSSLPVPVTMNACIWLDAAEKVAPAAAWKSSSATSPAKFWPFMLSTTCAMHTCTTPVCAAVRAILKPEL
jgi:hypothetical protein